MNDDMAVYGGIPTAALVSELQDAVAGEVRFALGTRALYSTDGSNYRQVPTGVVLPRNEQDVIRRAGLCRKYGAPLLPRGAGASLAGQYGNVAVAVDMSKYMRRIIELNPEQRFAWVEAGVILNQLRHAAEKHHLTFAPDPATHDHNTLGGMIGNNSCGIHSVMGGRTADNIEELPMMGCACAGGGDRRRRIGAHCGRRRPENPSDYLRDRRRRNR